MDESDKRATVFTLITVGLLTLAYFYHREPANVLAPSTIALADSLELTAPTHDSTMQDHAKIDSARAREDIKRKAKVKALEAQAEIDRARADSLAAAAAIAEDDASAWRDAHNARLTETITLRAAKDSAVNRADSLDKAAKSLRADLAHEMGRRLATERVNAMIKSDIQKFSECRILPGVRCPTRTEAAIGGVVVGGVTALVVIAR